jgi:hypothetical protein
MNLFPSSMTPSGLSSRENTPLDRQFIALQERKPAIAEQILEREREFAAAS